MGKSGTEHGRGAASRPGLWVEWEHEHGTPGGILPTGNTGGALQAVRGAVFPPGLWAGVK